MEEILKLQQQLANAQRKTSINKLAERNVVEILDLLIKKHNLQLCYSTDGREFITPEYLDTMIIKACQNQGRVAVGDLPNLLNVQPGWIEARLPSVTSSSSGITLVDSTLLSKSYLTRLCEEVNESLQAKDQLSFGELATKYELPIPFITSVR